MARRVLVVGGGIAGVGLARALKERAGSEFDVTIVTKDTFYLAGPSRPLLLTGEQSYERIIRGYGELERIGVRVEHGVVTRVVPEERYVEVAEAPTRPSPRRLEYDYLVLAPGVVLDGTGIEGYEEYRGNIVNVYEPGRVDVFKKRLWTETKGTVVVYAPPAPYRGA
ncbi:MAG: FAD-dependent oxidoreductase, partial [Desulfurococcales archaeon]|nr:FAD-dependent oxidoreductase [Desulfurococcales archaeon]